ncbi:MAG: sulfotransferase domain-containing protein [Planctomycetaceae bacterium]|nr:sulfotransferase domain-containing protein [Planctomycetaceae bacterium]
MSMLTRVRRCMRRTPLREVLMSWRHRGLRPTDYFLASYPKSGNTWVKFVLATLLADGPVDAWGNRNQFVPMVGHHSSAASMRSGERLLKTHEGFRPVYRKSVYLVRDPRDVCVSYFYHERRKLGVRDPFSHFLNRFLHGSVDGYGTWETHTKSWIQAAASGQYGVLVVRYEDLLDDSQGGFRRICEFLKMDVSDERLSFALADNTPDRMREKEQKSPDRPTRTGENQSFIRSARSSDWQAHFSDADLQAFNAVFPWTSRFISPHEAGFNAAAALDSIRS